MWLALLSFAVPAVVAGLRRDRAAAELPDDLVETDDDDDSPLSGGFGDPLRDAAPAQAAARSSSGSRCCGGK